MKQLLVIFALGIIVLVDSCSPTATPPDATTLNRIKTGGIMNKTAAKTDTNSYSYGLSCGCDFEFGIVDEDAMKNIVYNTTDIALKTASHTIKAYGAPGLIPGTYSGWLAIVTLKPDTQENFRDTLRDTVVVK